MQFVYVLTSTENDLYYEQFLLSLTSIRLYNENANIVVLIDKNTKKNLMGKRCSYEGIVTNIKVITVPDEFSQKEASRWIKTSINNYVDDDFLYIDCDTIVTRELDCNFVDEMKIGAVLDTHVSLDKHHLQKEFLLEDKKLRFVSAQMIKKRFNGGIIYYKKCIEADTFFKKWHSLWLTGTLKGNSQDMPSLNQANYELHDIITELNGVWNCQIGYNGLCYLPNAKIIHYFATSLITFNPPYLLGSIEILHSIKETGLVSEYVLSLLRSPLSAFDINTRIISDNNALDVINSSLFYKLLRLRKNHAKLFFTFDSLCIITTSFIKKIFKIT
jgi:hypothetical protein